MVTIKHTRESIAELEKEREQFKQQRDELIEDIATYRDALHVFARDRKSTRLNSSHPK